MNLRAAAGGLQRDVFLPDTCKLPAGENFHTEGLQTGENIVRMLVIGAGRDFIRHFHNGHLISLLRKKIGRFQTCHARANNSNRFSLKLYTTVENLRDGADMRLVCAGNAGMNCIPACCNNHRVRLQLLEGSGIRLCVQADFRTSLARRMF